MEKPDRGSLLLSAPGKFAQLWAGVAALYVVIVSLDLYMAWSNYQAGKGFFVMNLIQAALFTVLAFIVITPRTVKFFETGVRVPAVIGQQRRTRFLPWSEVERYYWVNDLLYLSTAKAVFTCAIQPRSRPQVDALLVQHAAPSAVA
jgi:hypothetical protein